MKGDDNPKPLPDSDLDLDHVPVPAPAVGAGGGGVGTSVDRDDPWPGLASFTEGDAAFFHGRECETAGLFDLVGGADLVVLYGQSGLGKTSLLQAGLFPRLRREDFLPVLIRPDHDPGSSTLAGQVLVHLGVAVAAAGVEVPPPWAGETLWEYFHRRDVDFWSPRNRLVTPVLVVDQFEELFTLGRATASARAGTDAFLRQLADLAENRPPDDLKARLEHDPDLAERFDFGRRGCKLVLALREDFLPDLEGLRDRLRGIMKSRMRLVRMNGDRALDVITSTGGHLVEPGVGERIVQFVAAGGMAVARDATDYDAADDGDFAAHHRRIDLLTSLEVEPALLSLVCRELNHRRRERGMERVTAELLAGSQQGILADFYERGVSDLPSAARQFIEDRLLTRGGYRNSVAMEDVVYDGTGAAGENGPPGLTRDLLDRLVSRRLLRIEDRLGLQRVELAHDVLAGPVKASGEARRQREAVAAAEAKAQAAAAEARRRRRTLVVGAAVALLAVGALSSLAIVAVRQRKTAERLREDADRSARAAAESKKAAEAAAAAARRRLGDLYARDGWARIDAGDPSVALLWFIRALETSAADPPEVEKAWVRINTTLSSAPRLLDAPTEAAVDTKVDGRWLYMRGRAVEITDVNTNQAVAPPLQHEEVVRAAAFSPDGKWVVTGSSDRTARVWDATTGRPVTPRLRHVGVVTDAAFSPDGRRVVTTSEDGTTRVWDITTDLLGVPPLRHEDRVTVAAFSPDGRRVVTASSDKTARVWDAATGRPLTPPLRHNDHLRDATFDRDGGRVATASEDGTARVWDAATGEPVTPPLRHSRTVHRVVFSPDGRRVATFSLDYASRVWDAVTGNPVTPALPHDGFVHAVAFSSDGRRVATAGERNVTQVWDAVTGELVGSPSRFVYGLNGAEFSPDGRLVATASSEKVARVWNVATGEPVTPPLRHDDAVSALAFSRDGRRVGTASYDGATRVWDAATGQPLIPPLRHTASVRSVAFSPDGQRVATASFDGTARVWDATTGQPLTPPLRHDAVVDSVAFSPDGQRVVTASMDETARVWDVKSDTRPIDNLRALAELLAGERIDSADGLTRLTVDEWRARWEDLRRRYPEQFRQRATEPTTAPAAGPGTAPATRPTRGSATQLSQPNGAE